MPETARCVTSPPSKPPLLSIEGSVEINDCLAAPSPEPSGTLAYHLNVVALTLFYDGGGIGGATTSGLGKMLDRRAEPFCPGVVEKYVSSNKFVFIVSNGHTGTTYLGQPSRYSTLGLPSTRYMRAC